MDRCDTCEWARGHFCRLSEQSGTKELVIEVNKWLWAHKDSRDEKYNMPINPSRDCPGWKKKG